MNEYNGDMIIVDRLSEFISERGWNEGSVITVDDIVCGIHEGLQEQSEEFGNNTDRPALLRDNDWHIGRIIYFINRPEEIHDIQIENMCNNSYITPFPIIEDGNHRFMAAMVLSDRGKINKIHCLYSGRQDLLDYLTGESDDCPIE